MKDILVGVGTAALIAALTGCGTDRAAPAPTGADLKGTWVQQGTGYENGAPLTWENQTVVIDEADGQGFSGFKEYTREGQPPQKEIINGVIGPNGDILIVDEDGLFEGRLVDGRMQGQYAEIGDDATAINLELSRS